MPISVKVFIFKSKIMNILVKITVSQFLINSHGCFAIYGMKYVTVTGQSDRFSISTNYNKESKLFKF